MMSIEEKERLIAKHKEELEALWLSTLRACQRAIKDAEEGRTPLRGSTLQQIISFLRSNATTFQHMAQDFEREAEQKVTGDKVQDLVEALPEGFMEEPYHHY